MTKMETFNLNEDFHQHYDDIANLEMENLTEVLGQMVGSISMINGLTPNASKSIKTSRNFDAKAKFCMRGIKSSIGLESTSMGPSPQIIDKNFTVITNFYFSYYG